MFFMKKFTLMTLLCFLALGIDAQGHGLTVSDAPVNGNWAENTTWYTIQNKKGGYVSTARCNNEGKLLLNNNYAPAYYYEQGALWCIVGNETDGYKFYNKAEGTEKALRTSNYSQEYSDAIAHFSMETFDDEDNSFLFDIATSQQEGYIVIKDHGSNTHYWNNRDKNLAYWNSTGATNDNGSSFSFVEITSIEHPTRIIDVNPYKCYTVTTTTRGGWSVNEAGDRFCSTNDNGWGTTTDASNPRNQFTVLRIHDRYYLYSIYAQKFVNSDCTLTKELGDQIYFTASPDVENRVRVDFRVAYINIGGNNQMTVDNWATMDDGNRVLFTAVDDFDADAAFDAISKLGIYTITYNYYFETELITTIQHTGLYKNEPYPDREYPFPFTFSSYTVEKVTGDDTVDVQCEFARFKYAQSVNEIVQWHAIAMHSDIGNFINATDDNKIEWNDSWLWEYGEPIIPEEKYNKYAWAFIGDPLKGFKLINRDNLKAIGVGSSNTDIILVDADNENAIVWTIAKSEAADNSMNFCLTSNQVDNRFFNGQSTVSTWDKADAGSTMWVSLMFPDGYYRISEYNKKYLQDKSAIVNDKEVLLMGEEAGAESLFYYDRSSLLSYTAGRYVNVDSTYCGLNEIGVKGKAKICNPGYANFFYAYIKSPLHLKIKEQDGVSYITYTTDTENYDYSYFATEYINSLPVTISAAKYASFYAPVAVTIPEGVTAYYIAQDGVDNENSVVVLTEIEGNIIPANTGVILKGAANTYSFTINYETTATIEGNLLAGTVAKANVADDAYILGINNGKIGLYRTGDYESNGYFTNGSHKSYLPSSALGTAALSAGFTFDFEGTTAIEEVVTEANDNIYYDLSGRRVENPTRGIYIVNGHKVMVK